MRTEPVRLGPAPAGADTPLAVAMDDVREAAASASFPLAVPSAAPARESAALLVQRLDDYVIPRLDRLDAPLLAVIGGSTGAGKSTLVNSLVRSPVSPAGVLRPTTRTPLLVCHPADASWFRDRALMRSLPRSTRPAGDALPVINAPLLTPGVALVDAPDIDSVVAHNRELARELLGAADLWLFVTTAARYADAVPWQVLREAQERGTALAIVLDRVPPDVTDLISGHLARMLSGHGLDGAPLFMVPESTLDGHGLLAERETAPIKRWLDGVARSISNRRSTTRQTLLGAIDAIGPQVDSLAVAADDQVSAAESLAGEVRAAYRTAAIDVESSLRGGAVLRGEVHAGWQELVSDGELRVALRATANLRRARVSAAVADGPSLGRRFHAAVAASLAAFISEANEAAALACRDRWRTGPAGRALLAAEPALGRPWPGCTDGAHDLVHDWQAWLRSEVRADSPRTRSDASAAVVLLATVVAIAPPEHDISGTGASETALRSVLALQFARALGERARDELIDRVGTLLDAEADRHLAVVSAVAIDPRLAQRLRVAADRVRATRAWIDTGLGEAA